MENYDIIILYVFVPICIFCSIILILAIISENKLYNREKINKYFHVDNSLYSLKDKKWLVKTALEISNVNFTDVCIMLKILESYKDRIALFYDNYTFNPYSIELSLNNLRKKRIFIDLGSDYKNEISIEILLKLFNYLLSNKSTFKFLKLYAIYNEIIEFEYFNELFCIYAREKINQSGKNKILL